MREAKPYWKASHSCWYFNLNGKPKRLDADKKKAFELYKQLRQAAVSEGQVSAGDPTMLVADLIGDFLSWVKANRAEATYRGYCERLATFCARFPTLRVCDFRVLHVTKWIDADYSKAGNSRRHMAIMTIKRAMGWGVEQGYIDKNPIAAAKKPPLGSRGDEAYVSPEQWADLLDDFREQAYKGANFADYVTVAYETGCRPQEIRQVESRHIDHEAKCWVFELAKSKSSGKTGARRVVNLTDNAYRICCEHAKKNPTGPLFRNSKGNPWTPYAVACQFARAKARTGIYCCMYSLRHTFATDAILRGVDLMHIKELMGHKDLTMLTKIYQHIRRKGDSMKGALATINGRNLATA
jgi:integrase/recombinase XerC